MAVTSIAVTSTSGEEQEENRMAVVRADRELCQGYANCVAVAEDVFDTDDEGFVVLLTSSVRESERARVTGAALSCPVSALAVGDE